MGKLIFCYGAMGASKSAELLMWRYNYEQSGYSVLLMKPKIDNREEFLSNKMGVISSRIGLTAECLLIDKKIEEWENEIQCHDIIMVDEAQFLTELQVDELYQISMNKTVICFGLRTDFTQHFFSGSKRLMELATDIRELKTVCTCGKKATINARLNGDKLVTEGEQIQIGANESYKAMCKDCFEKLKKESEENHEITKEEITKIIKNDNLDLQILDEGIDISFKEYAEKHSLEESVNILWNIFKNEKSAIKNGYSKEHYQDYLSLFKKEIQKDINKTYNALEISKYIINKCLEDKKPISHIQLQKILYSIQLEFLKINKVLFSDNFYAIQIGPVILSVYNYFCGSGAQKIMTSFKTDIQWNELDKIIIDQIINEKRELLPWEFNEEIMYKNSPYDITWQNGKGNWQIIKLTKG